MSYKDYLDCKNKSRLETVINFNGYLTGLMKCSLQLIHRGRPSARLSGKMNRQDVYVLLQQRTLQSFLFKLVKNHLPLCNDGFKFQPKIHLCSFLNRLHNEKRMYLISNVYKYSLISILAVSLIQIISKVI